MSEDARFLEGELKRLGMDVERLRKQGHSFKTLEASLAMMTERLDIMAEQYGGLSRSISELSQSLVQNQLRFERLEAKLHQADGRSKTGAQQALDLDQRVDRLESLADRNSGLFKGYAIVLTAIATILPIAISYMRLAGE